MNGSSFGERIVLTTYGASHDEKIGLTLSGLPKGLKINLDKLNAFIERRKPVDSFGGTLRHEEDIPIINSGIVDGITDGTPISIDFLNQNVHSNDYDKIKNVYRPGHADVTYDLKYGEIPVGGGRASGRETLTRVCAGGIIAQVLEDKFGITSESIITSLGGLRVFDNELTESHLKLIMQMKEDKDSIGGTIRLILHGVPAGLGEPVFKKLDAALSYAIMSIGAVKGVSFGVGFNAAKIRGSAMNDEFVGLTDGKLKTARNMAGGILGGISTGENIIMDVAIKPTPSIGRIQHTIDRDGNPCDLEITGRHDVTIVPRVGVVIESMALLTIANFIDL